MMRRKRKRDSKQKRKNTEHTSLNTKASNKEQEQTTHYTQRWRRKTPKQPHRWQGSKSRLAALPTARQMVQESKRPQDANAVVHYLYKRLTRNQLPTEAQVQLRFAIKGKHQTIEHEALVDMGSDVTTITPRAAKWLVDNTGFTMKRRTRAFSVENGAEENISFTGEGYLWKVQIPNATNFLMLRTELHPHNSVPFDLILSRTDAARLGYRIGLQVHDNMLLFQSRTQAEKKRLKYVQTPDELLESLGRDGEMVMDEVSAAYIDPRIQLAQKKSAKAHMEFTEVDIQQKQHQEQIATHKYRTDNTFPIHSSGDTVVWDTRKRRQRRVQLNQTVVDDENDADDEKEAEVDSVGPDANGGQFDPPRRR